MADRYRREGYWTGAPLGEIARAEARRDGSRAAIVSTRESVSYAELDNWADAIGTGFRERGIGPGDRVIVQLPNIPEFLAVALALFRIGAIPVFALPAHRSAEISYLSEHADAAAYVIPDVHQRFDYRDLAREVRRARPALREVVVAGEPAEFTALAAFGRGGRPLAPAAVDPEGPALLLLSGGTTGLPKLIPRTHDDYAYQLRATAEAMRFGRDGVYLAALPMAHNAALGCPGVLGALAAGGVVALAGNPSPDQIFPLAERTGATLTTLMPSLLRLWADTAGLFGADLSGLVVEVGGAPLSAETADRVAGALGCTLTRWFGMAEGPLIFTRLDDEPAVRLGTEGRPLSAADELRVVDDQGQDVAPGEPGELLVRGPTTLRGYYDNAEYNARTFTRDGFLRTGDLVCRTAEGNLVVRGRARDVINRGGEKIPAEEVETHLQAHPEIDEAAVVGVPDLALGEKTCAFVVPAGGPPTLAGIKNFLTGAGLAEFKFPDRLRVVETLPRTGAGKIDKNALKAAAGRRADQNPPAPGSAPASSPPSEA
ncbi:AMP-binding protein [Amycolatopsis sp. NPDC004079]|uniref:(2,3-dihydroxybenzoyl)adenylate synthase n=1 Tax=Amycolatopsis sp. NPDC004079 TaxID=3154549 RepID=UPI0033A28957